MVLLLHKLKHHRSSLPLFISFTVSMTWTFSMLKKHYCRPALTWHVSLNMQIETKQFPTHYLPCQNHCPLSPVTITGWDEQPKLEISHQVQSLGSNGSAFTLK